MLRLNEKFKNTQVDKNYKDEGNRNFKIAKKFTKHGDRKAIKVNKKF